MEQSANEGEDCGICLDVLTNPVALPCSHKFCSECLNGWRSKYGGTRAGDGFRRTSEAKLDRKCPLCRGKIPPSREMVAQLKFWQNRKSHLEAEGDIFSEKYMMAKRVAEELERNVGVWTETLDYSNDKCLALPIDICTAARDNYVQNVLDWLGPHPVDKQKLNARIPEMIERTLVHCAVMSKNSALLSILLQLGADVDPADAFGRTPLSMCYKHEYFTQARLLLEWGAEISKCTTLTKDEFIKSLVKDGNSKIANLLKSEFGGRRCEIINMPNQPDLIGKTCVVEKYLPDKGRYKVIFETTKEAGLVGPHNLKRRDRTPNDCGYYISFENGRFTRHEFASKEECQAFVASLTEGGESGDGNDADAEAHAEQAAASLLAELDLDSSAAAKGKIKKGKKNGKKKKGRKK